MKVLGISGSPRKQSTNHVLHFALAQIAEAGHETVLWSVQGKKIGFCIHCNHCIREKKCIFDDDMSELIELMKSVDALVLATPVYVGGVSGQIKTVMDRTRALFASDMYAIRGKPGIAIAVGGDRSGGQELAIQQIHVFYIMNGAVPVSGGVFGANLGASLWSNDKLEDLKKDEEGFRSLKKTLKQFIEYMDGMT